MDEGRHKDLNQVDKARGKLNTSFMTYKKAEKGQIEKVDKKRGVMSQEEIALDIEGLK